jgi:hypothetical protein
LASVETGTVQSRGECQVSASGSTHAASAGRKKRKTVGQAVGSGATSSADTIATRRLCGVLLLVLVIVGASPAAEVVA